MEYQLNLQGKQSEKQQIFLILSALFSQARSEKHFYQLITKSELTTYTHAGKMGIQGQRRRYRLKTLGFSQERVQNLSQSKKRLKTLKDITKERNINNEKER